MSVGWVSARTRAKCSRVGGGRVYSSRASSARARAQLLTICARIWSAPGFLHTNVAVVFRLFVLFRAGRGRSGGRSFATCSASVSVRASAHARCLCPMSSARLMGDRPPYVSGCAIVSACGCYVCRVSDRRCRCCEMGTWYVSIRNIIFRFIQKCTRCSNRVA